MSFSGRFTARAAVGRLAQADELEHLGDASTFDDDRRHQTREALDDRLELESVVRGNPPA